MDARIDPAREIYTVDDVVAAGAARARRGGREVILPGGMGVALIEELEQEVAREAASAAATSESTPVDDFTARIDAARERLREQAPPIDDV